MTTRPKRKKRKAAKKAAKKSAAKKTAAKKKPKAAKARGVKPARRTKTGGAAGARNKPKPKPKPKPKSSARRGATRERPHLLTSVRRPKAPSRRGSTRARTLSRRDQAKRPAGAVRVSPSKSGIAQIRDFAPDDAEAVNAVALAAFEQYRGEYQDWPAFSAFVGSMANLSEGGELIVALSNERIAGAVAYFGPRAQKPALFDSDWPVIRMLVVDPAARRAGLGRLLTEECISRARRDGADVIALHTSPIMEVALAMYLRLGFVQLRDAAPIFGVPYRIYLKRL